MTDVIGGRDAVLKRQRAFHGWSLPREAVAGDEICGASGFWRRIGLVAALVLVWVYGGLAMAADGLMSVQSPYGPKETMDRLEAEVKARGMAVFARIDHAAGAAAVGLPLRPTEVLIFGAARAGTPLMQADQAVGIDLPLKALVYKDASGKVWLANQRSTLDRPAARPRRGRRHERGCDGGGARRRCEQSLRPALRREAAASQDGPR